jgi:hypothetical protein
MQPRDRLLTFLSEKGEGRWDDLKEAWRWIAGAAGDPGSEAWIAARDLEALGHIEVAWEHELAWCAAPPLLTMIPRSGGRVFLTGARTRHLEAQLEEAADDLNLWVDDCDRRPGPRTIYVACKSSEQIRELADALRIDYTYQVAEQIAALLPALPAYESLDREGELPRGLEAERFDVASLDWQEAEARDTPGLYRVRTYSGQLYGVQHVTGAWTRVVKELGVYEVLRWSSKSVLRYSEAAEELTVPVEARLPTLHARAATLCSGRLPDFTSETVGPATPRPRAAPPGRGLGGRHGQLKTLATRGTPVRQNLLTYENVPANIAERIAASLDQTLAEAS